MPYKPRAGALRKWKYPIKIYKESAIPKKDLAEVRELGRKIKKEDDVGNGKNQNKHLSSESDKDKREYKNSTMQTGSLVLPRAEFSLAPVDIYESVYRDDNSMPPFPVKTCPDLFSVGCSDSDYDESKYEYDMDSEDEEWLNANKEYYITPARLEFIFSKLNQRDTHVPAKAIGALPEQVHSDFIHVFPYWKAKRLQNKNIITGLRHKSGMNQKEEKSPSGYMPTDPRITFVGKVQKRVPSQSQPQLSTLQKVGKKMEMKLDWDRLIGLREKLLHLRSWSKQEILNGFNKRSKLRSRMEVFERRFQENEGTRNENHELGKSVVNGVLKCKPVTSSFSAKTRNTTQRLSSKSDGRKLHGLAVSNKITYDESAATTNLQVIHVHEFESWKQMKSRKIRKMPTFEHVVGDKRKRNVSKKIRNAASKAKVRKVIRGKISKNRSLEREL